MNLIILFNLWIFSYITSRIFRVLSELSLKDNQRYHLVAEVNKYSKMTKINPNTLLKIKEYLYKKFNNLSNEAETLLHTHLSKHLQT